MKCRWIGFLAVMLAVAADVAHAQDFDKGVAAARNGDFAVALREWRPLADAGHAEAQFNLGALYEAGLGVTQDLAEAAGWYTLAAGQNHASAQYNLGVMYAEGRGVQRDDARAVIWLRRAAEQGHGKAQYNLGLMYSAGRGLPRDLAQANLWFDRAAANGIAPAGHDRLAGGSPLPPATVSRPTTAEQGEAETKLPVATQGAAPSPQEAQPGTDLSAEPDKLIAAEPNKLAPDSESPAPSLTGLDTTAGPIVAALPVGPIRITANLRAGERYRLAVTETRERMRDGALVMAQTSKMGIDVKIKADATGGTLIEWTYGPASVKAAGDPRASRLANDLGTLIDGQVVEYRIGSAGAGLTLADPERLTSFYRRSMDRVLGQIDEATGDALLVNEIRANLEPLMTADYAASRALELPRLLHFFSGLELEKGETHHSAGVMHLPPSADALPSSVDYELKWFDRALGVAWLRWRQSVEAETATNAIKSYVRSLAVQADQPVPDDFDLGTFEVADNADYEIDLGTGLPKQVIYTRKISLLGFSQVEKRHIRVTPVLD